MQGCDGCLFCLMHAVRLIHCTESNLSTLILPVWLQVWIAGKWLSRREQSFAPPGAHFHQFVVPPITEYRSDCTYGKISQINLPKDTKNMHSCMVRKEGREQGSGGGGKEGN